eukprot:889751-Prorocentrum_minimum.AAC.1
MAEHLWGLVGAAAFSDAALVYDAALDDACEPRDGDLSIDLTAPVYDAALKDACEPRDGALSIGPTAAGGVG